MNAHQMKPASAEELATAGLYADILEEIKHRISAIDAGTTNRLPVPGPFVSEFCYLQIRLICELMALGCLLAHGDIVATKKNSLQTEWSADAIVKALSDLHPDFFPMAFRQRPSGHFVNGKETYEMEIVSPPVMTKQEFLALYGRCGGILHRGNLKKLLKQRIPTQVRYPEITAIAQKFQNLLACHTVVMLGGQKLFLCVLRNAEDNMKVQVAIAEAGTPPEPEASAPSGGLSE